MDAHKTAALFAATVWYEECRAGRQTAKETADFARQNWTAFLPVANPGLGKLLMRIAAAGREDCFSQANAEALVDAC